MATVIPNLCLACGMTTLCGNRRLIDSEGSAEISSLWKILATKELGKRGQDVNLESFLRSGPFLCKKCYRAYEGLVRSTKALESKMETAMAAITALPPLPLPPYHPPKNILGKRSSTSSHPSTTKRHHTASLESPTRSHSSDVTSDVLLSGSPYSPNVSINIEYRQGVRKYTLTPSRKLMGKAVARGRKNSLILQALKNPVTKVYIVKKIGVLLRQELAQMCSDKTNSCLQSRSASALEFAWDTLLSELSMHAPVLLSLLSSCTFTRNPRQNRSAVIGMCCALLLKFRCSRMSLIQRVVSLVLYAGNSSKQIYERLQKLSVSMSHASTVQLVTALGKGYDNIVKMWKDTVASHLNHAQPGAPPKKVGSSSYSDEEYSTYSESTSSGTESCLQSSSSVSIISGNEDACTLKEESSATSSTEESSEVVISVHISQSPSSQPSNVSSTTTPNTTAESNCLGYKLVGDNIDKTVKTRYMRSERYHNKSLHYFHSYAVANRIDFSQYSSAKPATCLNNPSVRALQLLPSMEDDELLHNNFVTIVSRVLVENIPFFKETFDGIVTQHIPHEYSSEMARKSHVVPLGIILKNENKGDEMVDILMHLHQYVPAVNFKKNVEMGNGKSFEVSDSMLQKVLFGGDQLTASRIRGAQRFRSNCLTAISRLEGFEASAADFHVKLNLLDVVWKYFYSSTSAGEMGTLYQLRNLIGRSNVNSNPISRYNECDDFFKLIVNCHIVVAAMKLLKMNSLEDIPNLSGIDVSELWMECNEKRKDVLLNICSQVVDNFISFQYNSTLKSSEDKVMDYGRRLLEFGTFYLEFSDAIHEGDGDRVLRCWRYLLPVCKSANRRNYAIEVLNFLCQYEFELPPQQAKELLWSRFVSTHDGPGLNIPEDLHQEHLNRVIKDAIHGLGANKTEVAIVRAGKAIGTLDPVLRKFDAENNVKRRSGVHKSPSTVKDSQLIIEHLLRMDIFTENIHPIPRSHNSFPKPKDFLHSLDDKFLDWMIHHLKH